MCNFKKGYWYSVSAKGSFDSYDPMESVILEWGGILLERYWYEDTKYSTKNRSQIIMFNAKPTRTGLGLNLDHRVESPAYKGINNGKCWKFVEMS